jgi:glycosyltransferase involved in cell wall biosynthesis
MAININKSDGYAEGNYLTFSTKYDKPPLVSIIVPVYNSEKYIEDTLKSCLSQTYTNIELVIVNDGSTDNSENVILAFNDCRIKYYKIDNSGACEARNYGISKASGQLFQFLDHDDVLDPNKLTIQVTQYKQFGKKYIYSAEMGTVSATVRRVDEGYELYKKDFTPLSYYNTVLNQFGKYMTTGVWLVPACLIKSTYGWDKRSGLNDDGEYFMRVILNSEGIIFCPKSVFFFRRDVQNSLSKQFNNKDVYIKWLYSYQSYTKHFLKYLEYSYAKELAWKALSIYYCNSYPKYPDLLRDCRNEMKKLGYKRPAAHGGDVFIKTAKIIGVMNALRFWYLKSLIKTLIK